MSLRQTIFNQFMKEAQADCDEITLALLAAGLSRSQFTLSLDYNSPDDFNRSIFGFITIYYKGVKQ